jgi:hypothetical protein
VDTDGNEVLTKLAGLPATVAAAEALATQYTHFIMAVPWTALSTSPVADMSAQMAAAVNKMFTPNSEAA